MVARRSSEVPPHLPWEPGPRRRWSASRVLDELAQDVRFALRLTVRQPALSAVAAVILAVSIGGATAALSLVDAVLWRPLPLTEPGRLVRLFASDERAGRFIGFSYPNFADVRARATSFEAIAAHQYADVALGSEERRNTLRGELVTGDYFRVVDVRAALGRILDAGDDAPAAAPVVVLSDGLWTRRFGRQPDTIGRTVHLNGQPFTVVGVAPPGFRGSYAHLRSDFWVPMARYARIRPRGIDLAHRGWGWLHGSGRLRAGVTLETAGGELSRLTAVLRDEFPRLNSGLQLEVVRAMAIPEAQAPAVARALAFCVAATGLLLLIACANLTGVLLARQLSRQREITIRQAVGATQARLMRQWVVESLLLSVAGGVLAVPVVAGLLAVAARLAPPEMPAFDLAAGIDWRVVLVAGVTTVVAGLSLGLLPAAGVRRVPVAGRFVHEDPTRLVAASRRPLPMVLAAAQVGGSVLLVIVAVLLVRSVRAAEAFHPGFDAERLAVVRLDLRQYEYDPSGVRRFYQELFAAVQRLPGVEDVSFATVVPLGFDRETEGFVIPGHAAPPGRQTIPLATTTVGPDYFATTGIPIAEGRGIEARDVEPGAPRVAVVNQAMARRYWGSTSPVGHRMRSGPGSPVQIVGVARDITYYALGEPPLPYVYLSPGEAFPAAATVHVRAARDPSAVLSPVIRAIAALDPRIVPVEATTMAALRRLVQYPERVLGGVASAFGALAFVLAGIALYGLVSSAIAHRRAEIAVHVAVGARPRDVLRLSLGPAIAAVVAGGAAGVALARLAAPQLEPHLFGVSASDPAMLLGTASILVAVGVVAALLPARRALALDVARALRPE